MKICLIAEGSYPYVTGGVSSWINQLMLNMPEHEFKIIAITPDSSKRGQYKYKLPGNLSALDDVFIDQLPSRNNPGKHTPILLNRQEKTVVRNLMLGQLHDWPALFRVCQDWLKNDIKAMDLMMSRDFFDLVRETYASRYAELPFAQVYWTLHAMYQIVFALLLRAYPDADVYHAVSTGYAGMVGAFAADSSHAAFILTEHGIYTREREEEIIKADWVKGYFKNIWIDYFAILSRCAYACANQVVTLFDRNREIQCDLGCPYAKTSVIHNGVNIDLFEPVAAAVRERQPGPEINIGAIIRVVPIKDIKTMLLAFSIASRRIPQAAFHIMGPIEEDPDYYQDCMQYMAQLDLKKAYFTGNVDVRSCLRTMDMLVLTSISEGQPLAILEGLASTLPVITTDVGDCRVMINGQHDAFGPAGRVVPVMDAAAIADAIVELAEDYDLRRKMGEAGKMRVSSAYSFAAFIEGYRRIYRKNAGGAVQWQE